MSATKITLDEVYRFQELLERERREKADLQSLVKNQGDLLTFYQKENERLRRENAELRRMLRKDLAEQTVEYRKIEGKLDALEQPILKLILDNVKRLERPLSYEDIANLAKNSPHPALRSAKMETLFRRVRRLAEKKLLISPERGKFYPNISKTEQT
ncbi:MAG: hypothetical protein QXI87_08045 [Thermoproteota archaeon]